MLISIATLFCLMPRVAMELPPRTAAAPVASQFERKEYNVTDWCCQALCCVCCPITFGPLIPGVMGSKTIVLEPEEAVYHVSCPCCKINTRRPYGELGSVDAVSCCCCVGVGSELTNKMAVFPGSGCNRPLVDEIVAELKSRQQQRGDQGQIQRTEVLLSEVQALRADVSAIMEKLGVEAPQSLAMDRGGQLKHIM